MADFFAVPNEYAPYAVYADSKLSPRILLENGFEAFNPETGEVLALDEGNGKFSGVMYGRLAPSTMEIWMRYGVADIIEYARGVLSAPGSASKERFAYVPSAEMDAELSGNWIVEEVGW